jgi:anti-sigma B factor antagonist
VEEGDEIKGLAPSLDVEESRPGPETCLLALRGELDVATVPRFRDALTLWCDDESIKLVVVDLVEVTFVDSTGLMTLLNALRRLVRRQARLVLACSNPTVLRLFEATRTDATFEIVPTREQALAAAPSS